MCSFNKVWNDSPLIDWITLVTSSHLSPAICCFWHSHTLMTFLISVSLKPLLLLAADLCCVRHLDQPIGFWTCLRAPNIPLSVGVGSHAGYFPALPTLSWLLVAACLSARSLFLALRRHHPWCSDIPVSYIWSISHTFCGYYTRFIQVYYRGF